MLPGPRRGIIPMASQAPRDTPVSLSAEAAGFGSFEVSVHRADEELMTVYRGGDRQAFDALYSRYAKPLYNFFRRTSPFPELADDLLQKTFLKLHAGRHRYEPTGSFRGWIFTLARNVLRDEMRERARRPALETEAFDERTATVATPEREGRAREIGLFVEEALACLPLTQREVIVLSRYHGMSYAEIGELLGTSENAVKQRAFQAMRKLRRRLSARG